MLEEIVHEDVGAAFLDYLEAYPTGSTVLKALNLRPDPWYRGLSYSNPMTRRFFSELGALRKHAHNLKDLRIEPVYEGDWCFDTYNVDAVSACRQLKVLGMSVLSDHVEEDVSSGNGVGIVRAAFNSYKNHPNYSCSIIQKSLINTTLTHIPSLDTLQVFFSDLDCLRDAACGNSSASHFSRTNAKIVEAVKIHVAPEECQRLPRVVIPGKGAVLAEKRVDGKGGNGKGENGRLIYVPMSELMDKHSNIPEQLRSKTTNFRAFESEQWASSDFCPYTNLLGILRNCAHRSQCCE